jgi:spore maturation protein SpmB
MATFEMRSMRNSGPTIERVNVMKIFVDGAEFCRRERDS